VGADLIEGILMTLGGIFIWALFLLVCSFATFQSADKIVPMSPLRLFLGYVGGIIACALLSALSAYISPTEAAFVWRVPPEHYADAIVQEFVTIMTMSTLAATLGIALVGVPVTFRLERFGRAQIGWVLFCSIAISLVFSLVFYLLVPVYSSDSPVHILLMTMYLTGSHLLVSLFFCIGAGLRWRKPVSAEH
jgi:hypothetical protein